MNRKILLVVLVISMLIFSACNQAESSEKNSAGAQDGTVTLKLAGMSAADHPSTVTMNEFAERVYEETDGRVEIDIFPSNQLGDWSNVYQEIARGTIEMGLITHPTEQDSRAELLGFPFIATGYDDIEKAFGRESYIFKKIEEINEETGITLLAFYGEEFGGLGTVKEVENIDKVGAEKDILIRTPSLDLQVEMMKGLGFRTTTIPFADLYSALQTGVADGWIGGGPTYNYTGFRDVIKYYYQINDQFIATPLFINTEVFQQLNEEDRETMQKIAEEIMNGSFLAAQDNEEKYRQLLIEEGIEVIELSDSQIEAFAEFARTEMWPQFAERVGEDIINELIEYLDEAE
ncbi:TRAP transporter substrate-binding protein DctP [Oceanobacillus luteolus]|uniref:TRAP transporter substrate-binding protein DctP n=1 Tax=Oceanobacillus luteolus TaxID=1274358 RepID=A0ABW4HNT4_9BACI